MNAMLILTKKSNLISYLASLQNDISDHELKVNKDFKGSKISHGNFWNWSYSYSIFAAILTFY